MRFGIFYELSVPRPFGAGRRARGVRERPRAGPARGRARLRHGLGRRAPFSRGLFALERARGLPDRLRRPDEADPRGPRRGRVCARDEPSDPRRRARGDPRPDLGRAARVRDGPLLDLDRARRLRGGSRPHEAGLGRVRPRDSPGCGRRSVSRGRGAASRCPSAPCSRSRCRSRIRRCGSRSRAPAPSSTPPSAASAVSASRPRRYAEQERRTKEYHRRIQSCDAGGRWS